MAYHVRWRRLISHNQTLDNLQKMTRCTSTSSAASTIMRCLHRHHLLLPNSTSLRHFSTKYTAKITSSSPSGGTLSIEVTPPPSPPPFLYDSRGYPIPRHHLICQVTHLLRQSHPSTDTTTNTFHKLQSYLTPFLPLTHLEISDILKSINSPSLALSFFHFYPSLYPNFQHSPLTYTRMILILTKSSSSNHVRSILSSMEKSNTGGTISTVNILINFFNESNDLEYCIGLIKKWDLRMTEYTYKCLVQAHLRSRNCERAYGVYVEMRRKSYRLDVFAFNMLLDALAKDGKVDQVYKVFEDMKKKHCEPDEYTYTIMIRMTGKIGKPDESLALFEEMLNKGFSPNLIAYNTMIQALANAQMVDKAILVFSKMVERECRPSEFTYSVILNILAAEGQLHKLDKVVEISKKFMNWSIYAYLVRTLSKLGHASEAHRLFCSMWSFHDKGDRGAFLAMLERLCSSGKTAEAIDLLSKIHEKGVNTDTIMYNTVLSALGKSKQIAHLQDLYQKMMQDGPSPDVFTYNILISSFGRAGKVSEAIEVFEELENSDSRPDIISYNSLINCLGKNGNLDEAHMRFKEMREKGFTPNVVTYSTLIECFGKTDKVEMARSLFDEMLAEGCYPNIVTYNILLDCLERSGRIAEAVDLYAKLKQEGLTPDSMTYSVLERLQNGSHRKVGVRRKNPITGWIVSPLR